LGLRISGALHLGIFEQTAENDFFNNLIERKANMETSETSLPQGAGRSSVGLVDTRRVFRELKLKKGMNLLDMACGRGEYSLAAAKIIGNNGLVYAIDLWKEGIADLRRLASDRKIKNIDATVADLREGIPVKDSCVDLCLMAIILHDLVETNGAGQALKEAARVLRPEGMLAVIEFKKMEGPPGPPMRIRLTPEDVSRLTSPYGFMKRRIIDVGPYNYMMLFTVQKVIQTG
jgi:SAM-dependent methyltransferase